MKTAPCPFCKSQDHFVCCLLCGRTDGAHDVSRHPEMQREWVEGGMRHVERLLLETIPGEFGTILNSLEIAAGWLKSSREMLAFVLKDRDNLRRAVSDYLAACIDQGASDFVSTAPLEEALKNGTPSTPER